MELVNICEETKLSISEVQMHNELSYGKTREQSEEGLLQIWSIMNDTIERGIHSTEAILPGGLGVSLKHFVILFIYFTSGEPASLDLSYIFLLHTYLTFF